MAVAPDNGLPERDRKKYLLDGESLIFAINEHWIRIAEPIATVVAGLVIAVAVDSHMPVSDGMVANAVWWLWFAAILRALFLVYEWRRTWFIATNKRMLRIYGLLDRQVAMMPLSKVTDLRYERPLAGRLVGYGTFILESAGQNQALNEVHFVPHPDKNYRALVSEIFGIPDPGRADESLAEDEIDDEQYDGYGDDYADGYEGDDYDEAYDGAYDEYDYADDGYDPAHGGYRDDGYDDRAGGGRDGWSRRSH